MPSSRSQGRRWGAYVAEVGIRHTEQTTTGVHGSIPLLWVMMMTRSVYTSKSEHAIRVRFIGVWCYYSSYIHTLKTGGQVRSQDPSLPNDTLFDILSYWYSQLVINDISLIKAISIPSS